MKKSCFGAIGLIIAIFAMSITQVQAQENFGTIQVDNSSGNRSGISGTVAILNIDPKSVVQVGCSISSTQRPGSITVLLLRSSGGGSIPFFCPFSGATPNAPPPNGPNYYWVTIYAAISNPCGVPSCYTANHTLIATGNSVYIS